MKKAHLGYAARKNARKPDTPASRGGKARQLRIIAGAWRGRRLRFPEREGLRPTPDRVRETLFNWLATRVVHARCLDLFAGSGALGLEALSRGAQCVTFIEQDPVTARELQKLLLEWHAPQAEVRQADALRYLRGTAQPFDLVFLDPPFAADLLAPGAALLESGGWLTPRALIYVETSARGEPPELPISWRCLRSKRAGEVGYHLYERAASGADQP